MYIKVLYNIKKNRKNVGRGAIFEPKTLSMYLKQKKGNQKQNQKKKKKLTESELEPITSGLEKNLLSC